MAVGGKGGGGGPDLPNTLKFTSPGFKLTTFNEGPQRRLRTAFERLPTIATRAQDNSFRRVLSDLGDLRGQLSPGFGALTRAGVGAIDARRRVAIGNLRENLARRRIAGSSFGEDAISRAEAEFGRQEGEFRAAAQLQEIDAFSRILNQEQAFIQTELGRELAEAGFAAQMAAGFTGLLQNNLQFLKNQAAGSAAGLNSLLGSAAGQVAGPSLQQGGSKLAGSLFGA